MTAEANRTLSRLPLSETNGIEIVSQRSLWGTIKMAHAIHEGSIVVAAYGATYGTVFSPKIRELVAERRNEQLNIQGKHETVSLVSSPEIINYVVDKTRLHKQLTYGGFPDLVEALSGISFIRFPVDDEKMKKVDPDYDVHKKHYVNSNGEIQFFPSKKDLLLNALSFYGDGFYCVRSTNISGDTEKTTFKEAQEYATQIGAKIFGSLYWGADRVEHQRQRTHSQPIIRLPLNIKTDERESLGYKVPLVTIVRIGNTNPSVLDLLIREYVPYVKVIVHEEKSNRDRIPYPRSPYIVDSHKIKKDLLRASGIK